MALKKNSSAIKRIKSRYILCNRLHQQVIEALLHNVLLSGAQNATDSAARHARRSVILNHPTTVGLNLLIAGAYRLGATTVTPAERDSRLPIQNQGGEFFEPNKAWDCQTFWVSMMCMSSMWYVRPPENCLFCQTAAAALQNTATACQASP